MFTRVLALTLAVVLLIGCSASAPEPIELRQALRLKLIDEAFGVTDPDKRPTSLADIRINDVVIHRADALPSGDYDVWSDYGVAYRGQQVRRSVVVTLTRRRGEWRVLSMRPPRP